MEAQMDVTQIIILIILGAFIYWFGRGRWW
jgi:hypothetical protein